MYFLSLSLSAPEKNLLSLVDPVLQVFGLLEGPVGLDARSTLVQVSRPVSEQQFTHFCVVRQSFGLGLVLLILESFLLDLSVVAPGHKRSLFSRELR